MKRNNANKVITGFMTLTLVTTQIPVAALAEAADDAQHDGAYAAQSADLGNVVAHSDAGAMTGADLDAPEADDVGGDAGYSVAIDDDANLQDATDGNEAGSDVQGGSSDNLAGDKNQRASSHPAQNAAASDVADLSDDPERDNSALDRQTNPGGSSTGTPQPAQGADGGEQPAQDTGAVAQPTPDAAEPRQSTGTGSDAARAPQSESAAADTEGLAGLGANAVATYTDKTLPYHAGALTKADLLTFVASNYGIYTNYRLKPSSNADAEYTQIDASWGLSSDVVDLPDGTYDIEGYRNIGRKWVNAGTLTLSSYWEARFSVTGCDKGAALIDGTGVSSCKVPNGGESVRFTVKQVEGYNIDSVTNNETALTPDQDGVYTLPATADSGVVITYKASEQASITLTGDNIASAKASGTDLAVGSATAVVANQRVTVEVTPKVGYAVVGVTLNGVELDASELSFNAEGHVASFTLDALTKDSSATLEVTAVEVKLAGKDNPEVPVVGSGDKSQYAQLAFDAVLDAAGSVPSGLTLADVTVEYDAGSLWGANWQPLDSTPTGWATHAFGSKGEGSQEQVRITYAGNAQYPGAQLKAAVTIVDGRTQTHLSLNGRTSLVYSADKDDMLARLYNQLAITVVDDETGKPVLGLTADDFAFEGLEQEVGEQRVTVKFKGNEEYKRCEAVVSVTVTKAASSVWVNSTSITFGDTVPAARLVGSSPSTAETEPVVIIAGVDGQGKGYVSVDLSLVGNGAAQSALNMLLHLDKGVTVAELIGILDDPETVEALESLLQFAGIEDAEQLVGTLSNVLSTLASSGLANATVALGGTPSKAGVYSVSAVTTSSNYETSVAVGYLTIAPRHDDVTLSWNEELPGSELQPSQLAEVDFGAGASAGSEPVGAKVSILFAGTTSAGSAYLSREAPTMPGAYFETATIADGNYAARPISRRFTVALAETHVSIADARLDYSGAPLTQQAVTTTAGGEVLFGNMSYTYTGTTCDGEHYWANEAPTKPGTYSVNATFTGTGYYATAHADAELTIIPRPVTVDVENVTIVAGDSEPSYVVRVTDDGATAWQGADSVESMLGVTVHADVADLVTPGTHPLVMMANGSYFDITANVGELAVLSRVEVGADEGGSAQVAGYELMSEDGQAYGVGLGGQLRLSATPEEGWAFSGWKVVSGEATIDDATADQATLTVKSGDVEVVAHFEQEIAPVYLTVDVQATEGGTVAATPQHALPGQTVVVSAVAQDCWKFAGWEVLAGGVELADSGAATTEFAMGGEDVIVKAHFEKTDPGENPGGGDNPGGDNPGDTDDPGGDNPGGDNPGGNKPGSDNPGDGDNPGGGDKPDQPGGGDKPGTPDQPGQPGSNDTPVSPDTPDNGVTSNPDGSQPGSSTNPTPAGAAQQNAIPKTADETPGAAPALLCGVAALIAGGIALIKRRFGHE